MADASPSRSVDRTRLERLERSMRWRVLDTGLALLHVPAPETDAFHVGMTIRSGSRFERPEHAGASHFLEHLMFRGCRRYPDFASLAAAFEDLGGEWNAATGREETEFSFSGVRGTAEAAVDLFVEFLAHPELRDVEVERAVILRELEGETNELGHSTDVDGHLADLLWPRGSMRTPILGTPESLRTIERDTLVAMRDELYVPRNAVAWLAGGDGEAIPGWAASRFADYRPDRAGVTPHPFPEAEKASGPRVRYVEHPDNEHTVAFAFACEGEGAAESPVYEVIGRILTDGFSSRLCRRLREELGLVYDVDAATVQHSDRGMLTIDAAVKPDQLETFRDELFGQLRSLAEDGPSYGEVRRAVFRAGVDAVLSAADPDEHAARHAWARLNGRTASRIDELDRIERLGADAVRDACRTLFRRERAAVVVMGPRSHDIERRVGRLLDDLP